MDRASVVILERTLDLAAELLPEDDRLIECLDVIRFDLESPDSDSEERLQHAVAELLAIARRNQQLLIATRLEALLHKRSDVA